MKKFLFTFAMLILPLLAMAQETQVTSSSVEQPASSAVTLNPNIKGALCYIQADDQVVFVDEIYTQRLSLPGGTIEAGEDPAKTAEREAWEETGLVVHAKEVLTQTETAVVYHCEPASGVIAFSAQNNKGFHNLPAWYAPAFNVEIKQVFLAFPDAIDSRHYRYPEQFDQQVLGHSVTNAPIQYIQSAVSAAPMIHRFELPYIDKMQRTVLSFSESVNTALVDVLKTANFVFSFAGVLMMLPLILFLISGKYLNRLMQLAIVTSTVSLLFQAALKWPRPFIYQPELQLSSILGYGTPSIRAALAIVFIGYFYRAWNKINPDYAMSKSLGVMIALMFVQGFASILLGEQFVSDVLFGYVIGLFAIWYFIFIENKFSKPEKDISQCGGIWWGLVVVLSGLAAYLHSLQMAHFAAVSLAMAVRAPAVVKVDAKQVTHLVPKLIATWCVGALALGFSLLERQWPSDASSMSSYFIQSGLWFVLSYIILTISSYKKEKSE